MDRNLRLEHHNASCVANAIIADAQTRAAVMLAKLELELAIK